MWPFKGRRPGIFKRGLAPRAAGRRKFMGWMHSQGRLNGIRGPSDRFVAVQWRRVGRLIHGNCLPLKRNHFYEISSFFPQCVQHKLLSNWRIPPLAGRRQVRGDQLIAPPAEMVDDRRIYVHPRVRDVDHDLVNLLPSDTIVDKDCPPHKIRFCWPLPRANHWRTWSFFQRRLLPAPLAAVLLAGGLEWQRPVGT